MEDTVLRKVTDIEEIEFVLNEFSSVLPSIISGRINIKEYSRKLKQLAYVCVLENSDEIQGFASFYTNDILTKTAYISMIAVKEKYRGAKVGSKILMHIEQISIANGMEYLKLEVAAENSGAIKFYKKHGYEVYKEDISSFYMMKKIERGE